MPTSSKQCPSISVPKQNCVFLFLPLQATCLAVAPDLITPVIFGMKCYYYNPRSAMFPTIPSFPPL